MRRFIFKIAFVECGQEATWRGRAAGNDIGRSYNSVGGQNQIGRCELIEAHHIEEAVQITQLRYPDFTVMREGSEKICSA